MLKEGGTNREGGQIGKWERQGGRQTGRGDKRGKTERGTDREGVETGYKQGGGTDREEGGTDTGGVGALVAIRAICVGPSLSVGARCPRALVVRGWGVVVVRSRSRMVVVGARSALWFEGGRGGGTVVVAVWYWVVVVVVVALGYCCSWAAVPVLLRWVVVCWRRAIVVRGWGMVVRGWGMIVRGWGMVVVVV
jgi:hypothetical protein